MAFFILLCMVDLAFFYAQDCQSFDRSRQRASFATDQSWWGFCTAGVVQCLVHHVCCPSNEKTSYDNALSKQLT